MSKRRDPPVCPCGLSAETAGHLWVNHTTSCPDFIAKRQRMLTVSSSETVPPASQDNEDLTERPTQHSPMDDAAQAKVSI
ncbi:unnamed protein product [Rhizoctonia solani]|uniref:Uncharacterized protein n=1 Tax=Rhizoctonia solani TaxID=456999 RepID=A0A8H3BNQ7_9AGAM|nr:unnamed protein product [Rhizoctonia solani]